MIRLVGALLILLLLCGCGIGSMKRGNLDMDAALLQMAREMREETIGAFMNENCTDADYLQEAYALSLDERDYALVHAIRSDIWQEAAIFHCNEENWSIIKEKAQVRCAQAKEQGFPSFLGTCGSYVYVLIGEDAQWMRTYLEGL